MKRYTLSFADSCTHVPAHPDRTARRNCGGDGSMNFDVMYQTWPNRAAMLKSIEMQARGAPNSRNWRACKVQP